ncbi:MAG: tRNA glutamyl-Q(34) synthetase GluQRS [Pseudomonadota bacterium]
MLRFAPSPTGPLHLGHAFSLLLNDRMARLLGRPFTIRLEDIDQTRARPAHEAAILEAIDWLGIVWQRPMRRQSAHFADYATALARLEALGVLTTSYATRREIAHACRTGAPRDPDGAPLFPGDALVIGEPEAARRRDTNAPHTIRLNMQRALSLTGPLTMERVDETGAPLAPCPVAPAAWGDVVLARKDAPTSYHLSVTVDDALQGITHVVRGADLHAATAIHRVLQTLLDLPAPAYHHHALILADDGKKLSKSDGATSLLALKEAGATPQTIASTLESTTGHPLPKRATPPAGA